MTMAAHQAQPASGSHSPLMRETANVFIVCKYLRRSHCPPFLPKEKEKREEAASPIRQPSEADSVYVFCRSSKGYISSAKPVKSALGRSLDSTEMGTPPFTIQCPELERPSPQVFKHSRRPIPSAFF